MTTMPEVTAVRTWNKAHTVAKVTVSIDSVVAKVLGGRRAMQCSYALLWQNAKGGWQVLGLRSAPVSEYGSVPIPITEADE